MAIRSDDRVLSPEVGPKELVGTIEKVETHDNDPTTDGSDDPWTRFHDEWSDLGDRLKDTYRQASSDDGPSEEEIKDAFGTLVGAWSQVADSISNALGDPEVRQRLKDAGSAFATAVGRTMSDLGEELRDSEHWRPTRPDPFEEE